jgi:thymidylate synthase
MHLTFSDVNDAFKSLVTAFKDKTIPTMDMNSRNGPVRMVPEPVIITYKNPRQRVLFSRARDCNPFFHLFESLWMLAGRNDVEPLAYYNSQIANYSDDGVTFNGAYGYRWRHALHDDNADTCPIGYEVDQLQVLINHLKNSPESRRVVLQMWNVEDDLLKINTSKDVCCNLSVLLSVREETTDPWNKSDPMLNARPLLKTRYLDMTVINRSNDLVWGALGANVVHFSFLQEYIAACLDVEVGVYNQISNNLHVYLNEKWQPEKWLADYEENRYEFWYKHSDYTISSLVENPVVFGEEIKSFVNNNHSGNIWHNWKEPFLERVAVPMCRAFAEHKFRRYDRAVMYMQECISEDWKIAGMNWLLKRKETWEKKNGST